MDVRIISNAEGHEVAQFSISGNPESVFVVDVRDLDIFHRHCWYSNRGYLFSRIKGITTGIHRVIYQKHLGEIPAGMSIDHIDRNPKNNLLSNLRLCSHAQNCRNRNITRRNPIGYKGVYWNKETKKYISQIKFCSKNMGLGCFEDPKLAGLSYNIAAILCFQHYANINPIIVNFFDEEQKRQFDELRNKVIERLKRYGVEIFEFEDDQYLEFYEKSQSS